MDTYTLIAYKPASDDICRGCLVASYDSDFILESSTEIDKIITTLSQVIFLNTCKTEYNEAPYEITILVNGCPEEGNSTCQLIRTQADEKAMQLVENFKVEQQQKEQKAIQQEKERKENKEREQYLNLKKKYGEPQ